MSPESNMGGAMIAAPRQNWTDEEIVALRQLTRLLARRRAAQSWHLSQTEAGEPQLYVLGPDPEADCVACVSRIGSDYVLEDGRGALLGTEPSLRHLLDRAAEAFPARWRIRLTARAFLTLCAWRAFLDEKEAALEESLEFLGRIAPQLAVLA